MSSTDLCLMSHIDGGFELDGPVGGELVGVSGAPADTCENNHLRHGK